MIPASQHRKRTILIEKQVKDIRMNLSQRGKSKWRECIKKCSYSCDVRETQNKNSKDLPLQTDGIDRVSDTWKGQVLGILATGALFLAGESVD